MTHPGDDLQLYALGDLSPDERRLIEVHLESCSECSRIVGEAELALADLTGLLPEFRAPRRARARPPIFRSAIAAAAIIGLILAGSSMLLVRQSQTHDDDVRAQLAMTHSHFGHAQLAAVSAGAPAVKVLFARDHSWLYTIVDDGREPFHLVGIDAAGRHDLGPLVSHGVTSSLFLANAPKLERVELVSGDRVIARGMLK